MKKRVTKKGVIKSILITMLFVILIVLYFKTGIFQIDKIDNRDLAMWEYDDNGVMLNAKEFTLAGDNKTCWYVIHGYTSTPDEMRELAEKINKEFNETVIVTRLKGNGEVPSHILNLTLDDWYIQVSQEFNELKNNCENINLVGFSFGGALATRLAETKDIKNTYLLSPYLFATYKFYRILKSETYLSLLGDIFKYTKKTKIGQINSKEGLKSHIAFWNMPFAPVKNSESFFKEVKDNLEKITTPVLLQQSKNDETSDIKSSKYIYDNINSENKEIIVFEKSNHILMEDFDKDDVIINIINFEKETRI